MRCQKVKKYPPKTGQLKTKLCILINIVILQFSQAKSINKTSEERTKTAAKAGYSLSKFRNKYKQEIHSFA